MTQQTTVFLAVVSYDNQQWQTNVETQNEQNLSKSTNHNPQLWTLRSKFLCLERFANWVKHQPLKQ